MDRYWIGISGGVQRVNEINQKSWWCFPKDAIKGDSIFLYCPRSISPKKQGIYALYHLISDLVEDHKYNFYCGGFGSDLGRSVKLFYGEIELEKKYEHTLTAKEMKNDAALSKAGFVKKNFQGTTFRLNEEYYRIIVELLSLKNKSETF